MLIIGCSREPRREAPPSAAVRVPPPVVSPAPSGFPRADELDWQGPAASDPSLPAALSDGTGGQFRYRVAGSVQGHAHIARVDRQGREVWHNMGTEFSNAAVMLLDGERLYVIEYWQNASGARVSAFDAANGVPLWMLPVQGLGPIEHSRYVNQVTARLVRGALVLWGAESAGRYIEVFDPAGKMLSSRLLPR